MKLRRFLIALDAWFGSFSYYDEETDDVVIDGDEDDCYNCLMQTDEFHLLGEKFVRDIIHTGFTDYDKFVELCHANKAFAM